jgi:lipoprotein NlpI/predicted small lipoprotein YifL
VFFNVKKKSMVYKKACRYFMFALALAAFAGCGRKAAAIPLAAGPETVTAEPVTPPEPARETAPPGQAVPEKAAAQSVSGGKALIPQSGRSQPESLGSVRPRSGRGVSAGELNPVNYKSLDPGILLQMGLEQYQVFFIMGERYYNEGSYNKALAEYNRAISLKADYADACFARGRTWQKKGDLARAIEDYTKALFWTNSPTAYNFRGAAYAARGDQDRAISDFTQALALKHDYADALYNRGVAYRGSGQYEKAIADFSRLLQMEPKNAAAYNQRGTAYYYREDDEKALRDFSEAIALQPDFSLAWHNRGIAWRALGNESKATADLAEAARLGYRQ